MLDSCGKLLEGQPTEDDLKRLVIELARETKLTKEKAGEVESSLQTMAGELTDLRAQVNALSRDSRTDALTGIANRRAFDKGLLRMLEEADDDGQGLCLILVDIDHFKRFNDTHGHLVGDLVLRFVAQVNGGGGSVGLKAIAKGSPLAGLKYIAFHTGHYEDEPLMIAGKAPAWKSRPPVCWET